MAEQFSNKLASAVGIETSSSSGTVGVTTTLITGISTGAVSVGDLIDNQHYIAGTKVATIGIGTVWATRDSTNTASASGQNVKFLAKDEVYASPGGTKSIIIGGTFANNTNNQVNLTVSVWDNSASIESSIAQKIPVPSGSSFVISDAGKTLLEENDKLRVYCDVDNAIDVNLSILTGVS
tara:strand:- start:410 stop:949 length:540 start_codon:yes stop_codon:yes gene_type:complete